MLLSICFQEFIVFKFGIDGSSLCFFFLLFFESFFVLNDNFFILPCPPDLIFNFFFLPGCLFDCIHDVLLSPFNLNELMSLILFNNHFSSSFLSLMLDCFNSLRCFLHSNIESLILSHWTYFWGIFIQSMKGRFFRGWSSNRFLLSFHIWIRITFFTQYSFFKIINILIHWFQSIHFGHCFCLSFLILLSGNKNCILFSLHFSDSHIHRPFFYIRLFPIVSELSWLLDVLKLFFSKVFPPK